MTDRFVPAGLLPPPPKKARNQTKIKMIGRGRRPGRPNSLSDAQRRQAARTGELPHQFMLRVMRLGMGKKIGSHIITWEDILWAAKNAAPYYAARLAAVKVTGENKPPVVIQIDPEKLKNMGPNDLSRMLEALMSVNMPNTGNGEIIPSVNPNEEFEDVDISIYEKTIN
jgi:hypothetical protein